MSADDASSFDISSNALMLLGLLFLLVVAMGLTYVMHARDMSHQHKTEERRQCEERERWLQQWSTPKTPDPSTDERHQREETERWFLQRTTAKAPDPSVTTRGISGLTSLLVLDPRQFELEMVEFLKATGYSDVRHTGRAGDRGVDIVCKDPQGREIAVQCKRYARDRAIGSPDIQMFIGMVTHRGADGGVYITTSRYTNEAQNLAQEAGITLVDGIVLEHHYAQEANYETEAERRESELRETQQRVKLAWDRREQRQQA